MTRKLPAFVWLAATILASLIGCNSSDSPAGPKKDEEELKQAFASLP